LPTFMDYVDAAREFPISIPNIAEWAQRASSFSEISMLHFYNILLFEGTMDINRSDFKDGNTLILECIRLNHVSIFDLAMKRGANIMKRNDCDEGVIDMIVMKMKSNESKEAKRSMHYLKMIQQHSDGPINITDCTRQYLNRREKYINTDILTILSRLSAPK